MNFLINDAAEFGAEMDRLIKAGRKDQLMTLLVPVVKAILSMTDDEADAAEELCEALISEPTT